MPFICFMPVMPFIGRSACVNKTNRVILHSNNYAEN